MIRGQGKKERYVPFGGLGVAHCALSYGAPGYLAETRKRQLGFAHHQRGDGDDPPRGAIIKKIAVSRRAFRRRCSAKPCGMLSDNMLKKG